jgi:heme/copper-type cytochrome/quinol oxidase subunit 2
MYTHHLVLKFKIMLLKNYWLGDSAVSYQLGFQDPATTTMEGIYLFNLHLLFVIIGIVVLVAWLLFIILVIVQFR